MMDPEQVAYHPQWNGIVEKHNFIIEVFLSEVFQKKDGLELWKKIQNEVLLRQPLKLDRKRK